MELANKAFTAIYEEREFAGRVRRASGAERASYLAREASIESEKLQRVADVRAMQREEVEAHLMELPDVTIDGAPLPSANDPSRSAWIDLLPIEFVSAAIMARLGIQSDVGNSPPTPKES